MVGLATVLWASLFSGPPSPWATVPAPPRLMAGATDVAGELDATLKGLHGLMANIRDRNSAETALPQLRRAQTTIEQLGDAARQLGTADRQRLSGYVSSWLAVIRPLMAGLTGNTQAGPVIKPILDGIQSRLDGLAKT